MQLFVFIQGIIATLMCVCLFVYFVRSRRAIGRAVGFDKLCEAIFAFGTLFFSAVAQGVVDVRLDDTLVAVIRIVMFSASMSCSVHLMYAVHRTIQEMDEAERKRNDK